MLDHSTRSKSLICWPAASNLLRKKSSLSGALCVKPAPPDSEGAIRRRWNRVQEANKTTDFELKQGANSRFRSEVWKPVNIDLFASQELRCTFQEADIQDFLIFIEFLDGAIVGLPSHVFWLGWQIPFIRVKAAN